jgi:hypothetical protein
MRPRRLELPRTNRSTRPSTLLGARRSVDRCPDRPNRGCPWIDRTHWTGWMLSECCHAGRLGADQTRPGHSLWVSVAVLGLVTNIAYRLAYYCYGAPHRSHPEQHRLVTGALGAHSGRSWSSAGSAAWPAASSSTPRTATRISHRRGPRIGRAGHRVCPFGAVGVRRPYALGCGVISALASLRRAPVARSPTPNPQPRARRPHRSLAGTRVSELDRGLDDRPRRHRHHPRRLVAVARRSS